MATNSSPKNKGNQPTMESYEMIFIPFDIFVYREVFYSTGIWGKQILTPS